MWTYQRKAQKKKFNNKTTIYRGRKYDSKGEAGLAMEIDALIRRKKLIKVEPQVTFDLFGKNGKKICTHRPDFLVTKPDGSKEVMEYKGFATEIWRLKLKLFTDNYPDIPYIVVTSSGTKIYKGK